jgi:trimethylamine---corrinoid protein Co-methyltransferase
MQPLAVLSQADVDFIHARSLELLIATGIEFRHPEVLELFRANGAKVDGQRVRLPAAMIEECLASAPASFTFAARNPDKSVVIGGEETICAPAAGCVFVVEQDGTRRAGVSADYIELLKIIQASDYLKISGGGLVFPGDLPSNEKIAFMMTASYLATDKPVMGFTLGRENAAHSLALSAMALGTGGYRVMSVVNPDSPLVYAEVMLAGLLEFASAGQPLIVAPCSMAMTTSPATLAGTLVINNAETLAGLTLIQLIRPGCPMVYGNTSAISDMRSMNIAIGAPETALLTAATAQLARYYHLPSRTGGALTDAKTADVMAGYQSMLAMHTTVLSGASIAIHSCGILDSFLALSKEKFIIDEEIGQMARRFKRGVEVSEETVGLATTMARGPGGSFLDTEHTVQHFRHELWQPMISDRDAFHQEIDYRELTVNRARALWESRLAEYVPPGIDAAVKKDLVKYYERRFGWTPQID